jgi:hypothetical protein
VKTQAMSCVLRRAETLVRLLREAVEARLACPDAPTAESLVPGKMEADGEGPEYDEFQVRQSGARADAYALSEIRNQLKRLCASFAAADSGAAGLSVSERVALAMRLREGLGERRGRKKKGRKACSCHGFPPGVPLWEGLARMTGFGSGRQLWAAALVVRSGDAALITEMDGGAVSVREAARRVRASGRPPAGRACEGPRRAGA